MAKAVEDTAFYRFPRLLALNEVGGEATAESVADEEAHRLLAERGEAWPMALLATATHDTKRGEDARARLLVLAELPGFWAESVERWSRLNADGGPTPLHAADEIGLYQALVGAWPADLAAGDASGLGHLCERLVGWQRKSLREAKLRSSWLDPDEPYEAAAESFLRRVLDPRRSATFLDDVAAVVARLAPAGVVNSLAQTLIKLTAPGVPDIYQGCELWDHSLVDPDNRQPVDWPARRRHLEASARLDELLAGWRSGALKQRLIARVLAFRRERSALFAEGSYLPLTVDGPARAHAFAFARSLGDRMAITVVGRRLAHVIDGGVPRVSREVWADSTLLLPERAANGSYREIVSGAELTAAGATMALPPVLARLPVALLTSGP
jgi:(1->4)-alpha-D-glucan 1-alpha-D-glucosylmutase